MDPNGIIGQPVDTWVWLAPDWSDYAEGDKAPAGKTGWTRVKIRVTRYNDGRIVRHVLDAQGMPVAANGQPAAEGNPPRPLDTDPAQMIDEDQAKRFKEAQAAANKPPEERNNNGRRERWNPRTSQWEDVGPAINTTAPAAGDSGWHTEGTPDGQGGYDNTRPIMVRIVNGKREERSLSEDELRKWRADQQAGQPQTGDKEEPVDTHPGWVRITRVVTQNGNSTTKVTFRGPDGKEVPTLPEKPGQVTSTIVQINGQQWTVRTTPQGAGKPPLVEWINPQTGQVDKPPVAAGKPDVATTTRGGQTYTTITTVNPDGSVKQEFRGPDGRPIDRLPSEGEATTGGPPMPRVVASMASQAAADYWNQLANDSTLTHAEREKRFQQFMQTANLAVQQASTEQRDAESQRNDQYNRSLQQLSFMQNSTQNAFDFVSKFNGQLPQGSNAGAEAFGALMGLQLLQMEKSGIAKPPTPATPPAYPGIPPYTPPVPQASTAVQAARAAVNTVLNPPGTPSAAPAAPAPPPRPAAAAPAPAAVAPRAYPPSPNNGPQDGRPPQPGSGGERPDDVLTVRNRKDGTVVQISRQSWDGFGPSQADWSVENAESGSLYTNTGGFYVKKDSAPSDPNAPGPHNPQMPVPIPYPTNPGGNYPIGGPAPGAPNPQLPPNEQTAQNVPDFAVLSNAGRPDAQPMMQPMPSPSGGDYAVLAQQQQPQSLEQEAAMAVPWRMTPQDYERFKAAGIGDHIIAGLPGVMA